MFLPLLNTTILETVEIYSALFIGWLLAVSKGCHIQNPVKSVKMYIRYGYIIASSNSDLYLGTE